MEGRRWGRFDRCDRGAGAEVRVGPGVGEEFMFRIAGMTARKAIGE